MEKNASDNEEVRRFHAEAAALLDMTDSQSTEPHASENKLQNFNGSPPVLPATATDN
jgi:hypothetical protein